MSANGEWLGTTEPDPAAGTEASRTAGSVHLLLGATTVRLVLSGEIDGSVHADLVTAVDEVVAAGRAVQVDARHVRFMDSSGIASLAYLAQRLDSRLTLIQPPDVVRFLLDVTNLREVVDVTDHDPGLHAP